jgi:AraC-like DNA-binding protein
MKQQIANFILFFFALNISAQSDTIFLPSNINNTDWQMSLLDKADIVDTIPLHLSFKQIQNIDFQRYTKDSVYIKDDKCAWLRFSINNPSATDTAHFLIQFNNRIHFVYLFSLINGKIDSIAGGRLTDYYKRPYLKNKACSPIALPPQYSGIFWLKFNNFSENRNNLMPSLTSYTMEEKLRLEQNNAYSINHFIEVIFLSSFLILTLVSARMGYIWLDEGYTWYAIYIGSLFIFYFRDFENYSNDIVVFFSYFSSWHFEIEATLCYITYTAYMIFIQKFLDMKQFYPRLNTLLSYAIGLIIACLFLDLVIHAIWGLAVSFRIFIIIRLIFFAFYFVVLFIIGFTTASRLSRFIISGTILMLLPGLTSNIAMAYGGDTQVIWYGLAWIYEFPTFKLPMFGTRIGYILEACFFLYGLSWKARREYDELKKLKLNHNNTIQNPSANEVTTAPLSIDTNLLSDIQIEKKDIVVDTRVIEAFAYLEKNFNDTTFTVKKWAQSAYLSPSHFSKLIVEHTDDAPSVHIQRRRLQYAKNLMQTTTLSIAQVALESGYPDSNYFSRIFKKTFNLTPTDWQNLHKKG